MRVNVTRSRWVQVENLRAASEAVQAHLGKGARRIGATRWTGSGEVQDDSGKTVARVSYNGRVWTPEPWPACTEIIVADKAADVGRCAGTATDGFHCVREHGHHGMHYSREQS